MIFTKNGYNFSFDANKCKECKGKCCIGESGYIWINSAESKKIADFLKLSIEEFKKQYLIKVGFKFSLREKRFQNGYACIFFDEQHLQCGIYELRPNQCRTFPFWEYYKNKIDEVERECIGILR